MAAGSWFPILPWGNKDDPVSDGLYLEAAQNGQNIYNQNLNAQQQLGQQQYTQQMLAQAQAQAQAQAPSSTPHDRARSLFLARLGGIKGSYRVKAEDFVWCHITSDLKTVHVFFVFGDQAGNTSEDAAMFPSDTLITQFRLLIP